jgi:hypothetical protein
LDPKKFTAGSAVKGVVYRGEHGADPKPGEFQTRMPSISFGSKKAATSYAHEPNNRTQDHVAHSPRVIPAHINIRKPFINDPDDPFIDLSHIDKTLGHDRAMWVAREFADHVANTQAFNDACDEHNESHIEPHELLEKHPETMNRLCVQAYPLLDHPEFIDHLKQAGYDGAVYGGAARTPWRPSTASSIRPRR